MQFTSERETALKFLHANLADMLGAVDSVRIPLFSPFVPTGSGSTTRHRVHRAECVGEFPYSYKIGGLT